MLPQQFLPLRESVFFVFELSYYTCWPRHCAHIFNGFATLATMQEPEAVDLSRKRAPDRKENPETSSVSESSVTALTDQEVQATGSETAEPETAEPEAAEYETASESPAQEAPEPGPPVMEEPIPQVPHATSAPKSGPTENYIQNDYADDDGFDAAPSHETSPAWAIASLFLLVVLAAQAIYFFRAELSVIAPATRPFLEQYCELLGCTISLPPQRI